MNREITDKNLHLLLPGTLLDAIRVFYRSNTYKALEKEETKLWHYGPIALYEEFEEKK